MAYTARARYRYGWPDSEGLGSLLSIWKARISVGYEDLIKTGLFGHHLFKNGGRNNQQSDAVVEFLKFYSQYDFLKPPRVGKYGVKDLIPNLISSLSSVGSSVSGTNLRQQVGAAAAIVEHRRAHKSTNGTDGSSDSVIVAERTAGPCSLCHARRRRRRRRRG